MLVLVRRLDESIVLFDQVSKQCVRIVPIEISKNSVRIGIEGDMDTLAIREELLIQKSVRPEFREASKAYQSFQQGIQEERRNGNGNL